jgi:hypothetical protein
MSLISRLRSNNLRICRGINVIKHMWIALSYRLDCTKGSGCSDDDKLARKEQERNAITSSVHLLPTQLVLRS